MLLKLLWRLDGKVLQLQKLLQRKLDNVQVVAPILAKFASIHPGRRAYVRKPNFWG